MTYLSRLFYGCLLAVGLTASGFALGHVWATEQLDLTTPITAPSTTNYKVTHLAMEWTSGVIDITLADNQGRTQTYTYNGAEGQALMLALNTANLSVKSLQRRILEKLVVDGKLIGTISGTP